MEKRAESMLQLILSLKRLPQSQSSVLGGFYFGFGIFDKKGNFGVES
jgi:hypothetical protein